MSCAVWGDNESPRNPIEEWRPLLERLGLESSQVAIDSDEIELAGGLKDSLVLQRLLMRKPFLAGEYASRLGRVLTSADSAGNIIRNLSIVTGQRVGSMVHPACRGEPPPEDDTLATCLYWYREMEHAAGRKHVSTRYLQRRLRALPRDAIRGLALFFQGCAAAYPWLEKGFDEILPEDNWKTIQQQIHESDVLNEDWLPVLTTMRDVDIRSIYFASGLLLDAVQSIPSVTETISSTSFRTSLGDVVIGGTNDDVYELEETPLLIIDYGGDDRYDGAFAAANPDVPVSVVIDFAGEDVYSGDGKGQEFGSSLAGCAIVLDRGSQDDDYRCRKRGLAYSLWGVSAVIDEGGNDRYSAFSGEGVGIGGIGVLIDRAGNDTYHGIGAVQGFGSLEGCGLLLDLQGDDLYDCRDESLTIPSAQDPASNVSLGQGCGVGDRRLLSDGHSACGGVGLLVDGGGDDLYRAGVFGQGVGYYYGVGMLVDRSGEDQYEAVWYAQGAAAHEAVGVLVDELGDDSYRAEKYVAQGAAHDFSFGYLRDSEGNDRYESENVALGTGLTDSIGLFVDASGNDEYVLHKERGLGAARSEMRGSLRDLSITVGLFLDCQGEDTYSDPRWIDGGTWLWTDHEDGVSRLYTEYGGGMDVDSKRR